jgi:hypothetical protein
VYRTTLLKSSFYFNTGYRLEKKKKNALTRAIV